MNGDFRGWLAELALSEFVVVLVDFTNEERIAKTDLPNVWMEVPMNSGKLRLWV